MLRNNALVKIKRSGAWQLSISSNNLSFDLLYFCTDKITLQINYIKLFAES